MIKLKIQFSLPLKETKELLNSKYSQMKESKSNPSITKLNCQIWENSNVSMSEPTEPRLYC
jgi:hypothetical protein